MRIGIWAIWLLLFLVTDVLAVRPYDNIVQQAAKTYNVDQNLVHAVIRQESNYDPNAVSTANAQGLMQLIPATAERFGVTDPFDPRQNIYGGTEYLAWLTKEFNGDMDKILAGYNAGEGNVHKANGIPDFPETVNYVKRVKHYYHNNRQETGYSHQPVQLVSRKEVSPSRAIGSTSKYQPKGSNYWTNLVNKLFGSDRKISHRPAPKPPKRSSSAYSPTASTGSGIGTRLYDKYFKNQ